MWKIRKVVSFSITGNSWKSDKRENAMNKNRITEMNVEKSSLFEKNEIEYKVIKHESDINPLSRESVIIKVITLSA